MFDHVTVDDVFSKVRAGEISGATSFRNLADTMSGLDALYGLSFSRSFVTPFIVTVISGMFGLRVDNIVGGMASSSEKTLTLTRTCDTQMSTYKFVEICSTPRRPFHVTRCP